MLRACILDFKGPWEDHLHLVKFSYYSYQASIKMILFEVLYDRKYKPPLYWDEVRENSNGVRDSESGSG